MAKNKNIKRHNKNIIFYDPNIYDWGGDLMKGLGFGDGKTLKDAFNFKETFSGTNVGNMLKGGLIGAAGDVIGGLGNKLISGGLESGAGKAITGVGSTVGNIVGAVNPFFGAAVKGVSGILGGATNALFGSKLNKENIQLVEDSNNNLLNTSVSGNTYNDIENKLKNQSFGIDFNKNFIGKDGVFSNKAKNKYKKLQTEQELGRATTELAYNNGFNNVGTQNYLSLLARQQALGGPLFTHGSNFNNGVILIDEGGTHEENPYEGVQMGIDEQGIPNLVEEGEVVWNDYVFSNRLKPSKTMKKKYKLQGKTFADAARNAQKESEERPNDPISKRGLDATLTNLAMLQESKRSKEGLEENINSFAEGGRKNPYDLSMFYSTPMIDETKPTTRRRKKIDVMAPMNPAPLVAERAIPKFTRGFNIDNSIKPVNGYGITLDGTPMKVSDYNTYARNFMPEESSNKPKIPNNWLRYAPAIGSGIGVFSDLMGWTNKPDYTNAERVENSINSISDISFNPIGNYLPYKATDRNYYLNMHNANSVSGRRAILNTSNPSRNAALLAKDYNDNIAFGNLIKQWEDSEFARRAKVEEFNRGTNMMNSEGFLKAAMANADNNKLKVNAGITGAQMRDQIDARSSAAKAANLTGFFNNLGAIGKEQFAMNMIKNNPSLLYDWMGRYKGNVSSKGGYLTIKDRRRR